MMKIPLYCISPVTACRACGIGLDSISEKEPLDFGFSGIDVSMQTPGMIVCSAIVKDDGDSVFRTAAGRERPKAVGFFHRIRGGLLQGSVSRVIMSHDAGVSFSVCKVCTADGRQKTQGDIKAFSDRVNSSIFYAFGEHSDFYVSKDGGSTYDFFHWTMQGDFKFEPLNVFTECAVSAFLPRELESKRQEEYEYIPAGDYYTEGYNLYLRMEAYMANHLLFLHDRRVPATNNEAERLLRGYKRKQQQAVTFRSVESTK